MRQLVPNRLQYQCTWTVVTVAWLLVHVVQDDPQVRVDSYDDWVRPQTTVNHCTLMIPHVPTVLSVLPLSVSQIGNWPVILVANHRI